MAQDPFKVDQLQIEPGLAGTRLIKRATDGSLWFFDSLLTGGITLSQLAGLRSVANIMVVGKSGAGAAYTTVQSALDAIPASSSPTNPYFVLIGPGVYKETLNVVRDGVTLMGFGAVLKSLAEDTPDGVGAYHTMVIQAALGTIPRKVTLVNLEITNAHANFACVRVVGAAASTVGQLGIVLQNCTVIPGGDGYPLWATSANHIAVQGGSMRGSDAQSLILVEECASFLMEGVVDVPAVQLDFDTTGDIPSEAVATSLYRLAGCPGLGRESALSPPISSTLSGRGSLEILGCSGRASVSLAGNRSVTIVGSSIGNLTLAGSVAVTLDHSRKGTVTPGGTASLAEPIQRGTVAFVAEATKAVVFASPQPDTSYTVDLELQSHPANEDSWWITGKATSGFTVNFNTAQTVNAIWTVQRVMGGATN